MDVSEIYPENAYVPSRSYIAERPIDFATWLEIGECLDTELVNGVLVEQMAARYPHEWIFMWLSGIVSLYVSKRKLGVVLGSRTAVKISDFNGRLPDIVFVRADNRAIIRDDAIYGVPDLVIEIVSKNDRYGDLLALETDYRALGVPEIVFIDPQKRRVRTITRTGDAYTDVFLTDGRLTCACIPGFWLEIAWLFAEDKPDGFDITQALLLEADANSRSRTE